MSTDDGSIQSDVDQAIVALTSAARRTRVGPTGAERYDFGEILTGVLISVAANLGGVEPLLDGRPGSWEAEAVRELLRAAVGGDREWLLAHRTETDPVESPSGE